MTALVGMSFSAFAQKKVLEFAQLPKTAQTFVNSHFNKQPVSLVTSEKETLSPIEYKVVLQNGTEIEFDQKGNWTEVDGNKTAIPEKIIPAAILAHVKKSFPNNGITQISKERRGYDVELSNGLDLDFDLQGKFLKIDD